jgi:hypothetical protein
MADPAAAIRDPGHAAEFRALRQQSVRMADHENIVAVIRLRRLQDGRCRRALLVNELVVWPRPENLLPRVQRRFGPTQDMIWKNL